MSWTSLTSTPRVSRSARALWMSGTTRWRPWTEPGGVSTMPTPMQIEQAEPGGVSWTTRNASPKRSSRAAVKPTWSGYKALARSTLVTGIAASRHAGGPVVTASLDQMSFLHPVKVGDVVLVQASVNDVGRTSIEVGVRVEAEDILSGRRTHTSSAYLVFVALDEQGQPRPVRGWIPETAAGGPRRAGARSRGEHRLATAEAIRRRRD